jgi:Protein of unknown function DUF45
MHPDRHRLNKSRVDQKPEPVLRGHGFHNDTRVDNFAHSEQNSQKFQLKGGSVHACIDYVVAHELAHAVHPNHGIAIYELLGTVMTDWEVRKDRLERILT